jgi:hypothetical protein
VNLSASPSTLTAAGPVLLAWSTSNALSCIASGGWSGYRATSGSTSVTPSISTTYILTCLSPSGAEASQAATVTVAGAPTVTLAATPAAIDAGGTANLVWSSTGATSCTASDGWSGAQATSGSSTVSPSVTTSYTLTCASSTHILASQSTTVTVAPPAVITSFAASASTSGVGNQLNLNWSATSAQSCSLSATDGTWATPGGVSATSGAVLTGVLTQVATYQATLTCLPTGPNSTALVSVNVLAPVPLLNPAGLAFAGNGNLYVANEGQMVGEGTPQVNGQILVYAPNTPGSNGQLMQQPQLTIGSPLQNPVALAFDTLGNIYVADVGPSPNQILVFDSAGVQQTGATITICNDCAYAQITGVTVDNSGVVYASVSGSSPLIQVFAYASPLQNPQNVNYWFTDSSGDEWNSITSIGFDGLYVWAGIQTSNGSELAAYTPAALNGNTNPLQLSNRITNSVSTAAGIAFDERAATQGNILVADAQWQFAETSPITIYSASNFYSYITPNFNDTANPALNTPAGIAIDGSGNVYVADSNNSAIDVYTAAALAYEYSPEPAVSLSAAVGGAAIAQGTAQAIGTPVTYSWTALAVPAGGSCTLSDNQDTPTVISNLPLSGSQTLSPPVTGDYTVFISCTYSNVQFTPTPSFTIYVPQPTITLTATVNGVPIVQPVTEPQYTLMFFHWNATNMPAGSTCGWSDTNSSYQNGQALQQSEGTENYNPGPYTFTVNCGNGTYSAPTATFTVTQ